MYRPIARWWWPGNDVDAAELKREVDVLDKAGFGGAEIQPFDSGVPALGPELMKRVNDYPSPAFFKNVATAAEAARNHGMFIDYTFGSGWPFGGAEITPELTTVELRWSQRSIAGPAKLHTRLELPGYSDEERRTLFRRLPAGWAKRLQDRMKIVAVVAVRGGDPVWYQSQAGLPEAAVITPGMLQAGSSVVLTDRMQPDGTLDWEMPAGTWQVFVFRTVPTVHRVHHGAGAETQLEMNHLDAAAFAAHAKAVGDDAMPFFKPYIGDGLRAIFCDSLEMTSNLYWSDNFLAEFRKRRGYDLTPYLPILKIQGASVRINFFENRPAYDMAGIGDAVRRDYTQTLSDVMIDNFFNPFNRWAHDHQLLSRTQAHGSSTDLLKVYGDADIPETEDLANFGHYEFLKEASSAAHSQGKAAVGSESFVWSEMAYQATPAKLKWASDELFTAGINAIVYHGFPYVLEGQADPGWAPFAYPERKGSFSESFNEKNPFWPYLAKFNDYLTRVQYVSRTGTNVAQLAVYRYELEDFHNGVPPMPHPLNEAVTAAGYNYDWINEDSLLHATVAKKELVTAGGAHYRVLVMPSLPAISSQLAEKLRGFAQDGLPVIFSGEVPSSSNSMVEREQGIRQVREAMGSLASRNNVYRVNGGKEVVTSLAKVEKPHVQFKGQAFPYFEKRIGGMTFYFLRNANSEPEHVTAEFAAQGTPELWDPWTGTSALLRDVRAHGSTTEVSFDLTGIGSAMIVFTPHATTQTQVDPETHLAQTYPVGETGWSLTATGLMPDGKTATVHRSIDHLQSWIFDPELKGLSGHGVYTTTFTAPSVKAGDRVRLDLGDVGDVAEVKVNGQSAGTRMLMAYTVDVTSLLHAGQNTLEVTVTNALFNAMSQRKPQAFGVGKTQTPSGLLPAGLLGPVQLEVMR